MFLQEETTSQVQLQDVSYQTNESISIFAVEAVLDPMSPAGSQLCPAR